MLRCGGPIIPNLWLGTSVEQRQHLDRLDGLHSIPAAVRFTSFEPLLEDLGEFDLTGLHWAIAGAESNPPRRARPMELDWVRNIRDRCIAAEVAFFFKQDAISRGKTVPVPELDGRRWGEYPQQGEAESLPFAECACGLRGSLSLSGMSSAAR